MSEEIEKIEDQENGEKKKKKKTEKRFFYDYPLGSKLKKK
jgi:hypothetical protein